MPVISKPQKMATRVTLHVIRFYALNKHRPAARRRTDENFLPTLKHRQSEGCLEPNPPLPKKMMKSRTGRCIDQSQVSSK